MRCGLFCLKTGCSVSLKKNDVNITIGATIGHVESTLLYLNEAAEDVESIFTFPLEEQSAVYKFEAEIDGRVIIAECQEKEQASEAKAVPFWYTLSIIEEIDQNSDIFKCRLGNLPSGGQVKITMAYVLELPHDIDGKIRFKLPKVLNPRYEISAIPRNSNSLFVQAPIAPNCGQYEMSFVADVQSQCKIKSITSESDNINIVYSNDYRRAQVKLADPFKGDHDISFLVNYEDVNHPQAIIERGYSKGSDLMKMDVLMLSFYPNITGIKGNATDQGEYIFAIDTYIGSRGGDMKTIMCETILLCLKSLPVGCYFNLIPYGNYNRMLFDSVSVGSVTANFSREYNQSHLNMATGLLQALQLFTERRKRHSSILQVLEEIYKTPPVPGHHREVILITDGVESERSVQNIIQLVRSNAGNTRVFSVGIDIWDSCDLSEVVSERTSIALVKGIARAGNGMFELVQGTERLQQKVMSILKCAIQPTVTNLEVSLELPPGVSAVTVPKEKPNVFSGERLTLYALIHGAEDKEEINGTVKLGGQIESVFFEHCLAFTASGHQLLTNSSAPIHRLAAKSQIDELEDEELIEDFQGSNTEQKQQTQKIILVSTSANVVSQYTSFVGVDKHSKVQVIRDQPTPTVGTFIPGSISGFKFVRLKPTSGEVGCGSTFGSNASNCFAPCGVQSSMCTKIGFSAAKHSVTELPASTQSSCGSFGSTNRFGNSTTSNQTLSVFGSPVQQSFDGSIGSSSSFSSQTAGLVAAQVTGFSQRSTIPQQPQGMTRLIFLQNFDGSWNLTEDFSKVIGASLDVLQLYSKTGNLAVWATCLAITWLEKHQRNHKEEWEMIKIKSQIWLSTQNTGGVDINIILAAAESFIQQF